MDKRDSGRRPGGDTTRVGYPLAEKSRRQATGLCTNWVSSEKRDGVMSQGRESATSEVCQRLKRISRRTGTSLARRSEWRALE